MPALAEDLPLSRAPFRAKAWDLGITVSGPQALPNSSCDIPGIFFSVPVCSGFAIKCLFDHQKKNCTG